MGFFGFFLFEYQLSVFKNLKATITDLWSASRVIQLSSQNERFWFFFEKEQVLMKEMFFWVSPRPRGPLCGYYR
jgi:hypothetical protein